MGLESARMLRFPYFSPIGTEMWQGCQPYPPAAEKILSIKNSFATIGNWTDNLPVCSSVPQPPAPRRVSYTIYTYTYTHTYIHTHTYGHTQIYICPMCTPIYITVLLDRCVSIRQRENPIWYPFFYELVSFWHFIIYVNFVRLEVVVVVATRKFLLSVTQYIVVDIHRRIKRTSYNQHLLWLRRHMITGKLLPLDQSTWC